LVYNNVTTIFTYYAFVDANERNESKQT